MAIGPWFEAKYHGVCPECEERIKPGDKVHYADDDLVHDHCPIYASATCPSCHLQHAGECF